MLRIERFYYKDEESPQMIFSLDWYSYEDHWSQRYMFDRPMWPEDMMERMRLRNLARCKWFRLTLNIMHYKIGVDFKRKHVGNVYYGRIMKDEPHVPNFVKRNRERKKAEQE